MNNCKTRLLFSATADEGIDAATVTLCHGVWYVESDPGPDSHSVDAIDFQTVARRSARCMDCHHFRTQVEPSKTFTSAVIMLVRGLH